MLFFPVEQRNSVVGEGLSPGGFVKKRGEQCARGGSRGAGTGHDFGFDRRQAASDGGGGTEMVEEAVADLGP